MGQAHSVHCGWHSHQRYFDDLEEVITTGDIPAAFIVNVDESGFDQFVDARQSRRIVPARYDLNSVPVGISRTEKRATLIAAICGDGAALKPLVVVQRETVETELLLPGSSAQPPSAKTASGGRRRRAEPAIHFALGTCRRPQIRRTRR